MYPNMYTYMFWADKYIVTEIDTFSRQLLCCFPWKVSKSS